jgi:hypothetical protein
MLSVTAAVGTTSGKHQHSDQHEWLPLASCQSQVPELRITKYVKMYKYVNISVRTSKEK